ncbi:hypothetical protein NHQ30_010059 [Ciborinia camelliae]|nr:hypothetical protein NHQ30_010059 [Ciborinia camelliae]
MYIPRTLDTKTLTTRAESSSSKGFWQVQFNFWGTILAFFVAIGILTGLLTWCLVCRGKRIEKRLAKKKEQEKEERKRAVARAVDGEGVYGGEAYGARGTGRNREIDEEKEEFEMNGYGHGEERGDWGLDKEMGLESPVSSSHSMDEEKGDWRGQKGSDGKGNVNADKEKWHRIDVNGVGYMGRERGESAYLEGRDINVI